MFDVDYIAEATISAAQKEKQRLWDVVFESDFSVPLACFVEMLDIHRLDETILYWSFMFGTHGGL